MTAEIAILNKNGVALASDSAVTIQKPGTQKIYNTANNCSCYPSITLWESWFTEWQN